jgi:hypothetical protein
VHRDESFFEMLMNLEQRAGIKRPTCSPRPSPRTPRVRLLRPAPSKPVKPRSRRGRRR